MDKILLNLANFLLVQYCIDNNIDCSGTYVYKYNRRYMYALLKTDTGKLVVLVKLNNYSTPSYSVNKNL